MIRTRYVFIAWALLLAARPALAQDAPATQPARRLELTTQPAQGPKVQIPDPKRPTLLLLLRMEQPQSRKAVEQAKSVLADTSNVQVLVIVSGPEAADKLNEYAKELPWPVAGDRDYSLIGRINVHVWPTAVIAGKDGVEIARLRGLGQSFAAHLAAYLAYAGGAIDQATLQQKLAATAVVSDSAQQMARRHLNVAQRLLDKGLIEQAEQEIQRGLTLAAEDPHLLLFRARLLLLMNQPRQVLAIVDKIDAKAVSPGAIGTLRGAALLAMGETEKAATKLQEALKINPDPAEACYFLGLARQKLGQPDQAAAAFKAAFEATDAGKLVSQVKLPK